MRTIRLMADYQCFPLWACAPDEPDNIDPESLPISPELRAALVAWAETFDSALDWNDPGNSPPMSAEDEAAFEAEKRRLAERLRAELGDGWRVVVGPG